MAPASRHLERKGGLDGREPQDREGPRLDDPGAAPAAGRSDDRMMDRRAFISGITLGFLAAEAQEADLFHPWPSSRAPPRLSPQKQRDHIGGTGAKRRDELIEGGGSVDTP